MNQAGEIRPGGRTARTRAAVLAAVIEELTDHGWDQLSVESVAQRDVAAQSQAAASPIRRATTRRGSACDGDGVSGHGGNGF